MIANPHFIPLYKYKNTINFLFSKTKNIYLTAIGTDWIYVKYSSFFDYWPHMDDIFIKLKYMMMYRHRDLYLLKFIKCIIPSLYDYAEPYRLSPFKNKLSSTIPLPFETNFSLSKNINLKPKIVIFHGIIRRKFKGSQIIEKALNRVKVEFPNDVEIIIKGKMSFTKYHKFLDSIDILVDQCKSYSYGMNTLYALSKGKIVLTGFHELSKKELNIDYKTPFLIGISPSEDIIYEEIKKVILAAKIDKNYLYNMAKLSIKYVKEVHSAYKISKRYLDVLKA